METPSSYVRAFLKLQDDMFVMAWEDARQKENWYCVELWMAWRYACRYRITRLVNANVDLEHIITECEDQMRKTEVLKEKAATIEPRGGPNSDIQYLFLFD